MSLKVGIGKALINLFIKTKKPKKMKSEAEKKVVVLKSEIKDLRKENKKLREKDEVIKNLKSDNKKHKSEIHFFKLNLKEKNERLIEYARAMDSQNLEIKKLKSEPSINHGKLICDLKQIIVSQQNSIKSLLNI